MASTLGKFLVSSPLTAKSVTLLRPATRRFMSTNTTSLECNIELNANGGCTSEVAEDAFNKDVCPGVAATSNLGHLLNSMDNRIRFRSARSRCPRWDVFQDAQALYIVRDLSGLPKSLHLEKFTDYELSHMARARDATVNVFGCVRVHRMVQAIEVTVGREGPDPGISINGVYYQGYSGRIELPSTLYKPLDVTMDVNNEVLKITVPKEEGKWIQNFYLRLIYHSFTGCWRRDLSSF